MIFDRLENAESYLGISPELDGALKELPAFIEKYRGKGRIDCDGERLYANGTQYGTSLAHTGLFEVHRRYIDIHVVLAGEELAQCLPVDETEIEKEYDEAIEAALCRADAKTAVHLRPGFFAVFFPGEAHRTGLAVGAEGQVSKFIVKALCRA